MCAIGWLVNHFSAAPMYRKVKSFLSVFIKLLYNFAELRGNLGFINSIEKWVEGKKSTELIFESRPTAWHKKFTKETELANFDNRFYRRGEYRLFNDIRWRLCRDIKIYYIYEALILGESATLMSPDGRVFKELTYPVNGRDWRLRDFYGRVFLPAARFKAGWYTSLTCPTS